MLFWRSTTSKPDRYEVLTKLLDRNSRWSEVADAKAGVVLVFTAAVMKELVAAGIKAATKLGALLLLDRSAELIPFSVVFAGLFLGVTIGALYAVLQAFFALYPRLIRQQEPGYVFFGDIAKRRFDDYQHHMLVVGTNDLNRDLIEQVHSTAVIAAIKHDHVRRAVRGVFLTLIFGLPLYGLAVLSG